MAAAVTPHRAPCSAWRTSAAGFPCQHRRVRISRPTWTTRSLGLLATVLLTAGCAAQADTDDAASTGAAPSSSSAAASTVASTPAASGDESVDEGADASPFPADTNADVADPVDPDGLVVTTVRAARHEGYDRVVFELAGTGTPGWSVEYVDTPSSQGRGEEVDVPGVAQLQVTLQGTTNPYET